MKAKNHHCSTSRVRGYHGRYHTKKQQNNAEPKRSAKHKTTGKKKRKAARSNSKTRFTNYRLFEKPTQSKVSCQPKMSENNLSSLLKQGGGPTFKTAPLIGGAGFKAAPFTGGHRA